MTKFEFEGIGTHWQIDIKEKLSEEREFSLIQKIKNRIDIFDKDYSRFRSDSLVTKMSKESGVFEMPEDFEEMFQVYKKCFDTTSGLVTPLIGQVLVDAGYGANYSLVKGNLSKPKKLNEVLEWSKPNLILKEPTLLDFGACGKGYLVDIVSKIIEQEGVWSYCVDASGDMRQRSKEAEVLRVGLEHPEDKDSVIGVVDILNKSLCGSAGNRRKWADMHHIVNPESLKSPTEILSVWVISNSTMVSDALTTCLFFVDPEILKKHFEFEYLILNSDYSVKKSEGFNAQLFVG